MGTPLDDLNERTRAIIRRLPPPRLPRMFDERLSDDPLFQFGFSDFIPRVETSEIAGRFLVAVYVGRLPRNGEDRRAWRYFTVFIPSLLLRARGVYTGTRKYASDVRPFEYHAGDAFQLPDNLPDGREIIHLLSLPDFYFEAWIGSVRNVLVEFATSAVHSDLTRIGACDHEERAEDKCEPAPDSRRE